MLTRDEFNAVLARVIVDPERPDVLLVGGYQYAVLKVYDVFSGRNWRRIKREVRKAGQRYKKEHPRTYTVTPSTGLEVWF